MGFQQNVQFAPFYVAERLGYYRQAGLKVNFQYQNEPNALTLLSNGNVDFVDSGGDEVLTAGASGRHVRYVMTQYSRFPSALFFLRGRHIKRVADLRGKTIGIPGKYGASYFGLLTLLAAGHVPISSVHIESINFTQVPAVVAGKVDAAMGYAPNEPVELRALGKKVGEFDVYHWADIAGAGIATSDSMLAKKPKIVRTFVRATLRGLRFTLEHPARTFALCRASIPGITDLKLQRRILYRALDFWKPARVPLGHMDPHVWQATERILHRFGQIPNQVRPGRFYTNRYVG